MYIVMTENKVEFIDMTTEDGVQAYQRSILFIMMAAVNILYPDKEVVVEHSVNNGIYFEFCCFVPERVMSVTWNPRDSIAFLTGGCLPKASSGSSCRSIIS